MTVKEIASVCQCPAQTVKNKIREMFPGRMQNGKLTMLSQEESIQLVDAMRKKGFIEPIQNGQDDRIERLEKLVEKMILSIPAMINQTIQTVSNQPKLEYKQDYYGIIGYANKKGIRDLPFSDALKLGFGL